MSLLSNNRLLVGLTPACVTLTHTMGLLRSRIAARRSLECEPAPGAPSWKGAVAALAQTAEALGDQRIRVTVVLSNHFVRYAVVPFEAALSGETEELAHARFHFTRIHGDAAASWHIRRAHSPRGAASLASAVDRMLLEALRACFPVGARARLISVQPWLMPAQNRRNDAAPWLLLIEPGCACLAYATGGRWLTVQTTRGDFLSPGSWAALLARCLLQCDGAEPGEVLVHSATGTDFAPFNSGPWRFAAAGGVKDCAIAP